MKRTESESSETLKIYNSVEEWAKAPIELQEYQHGFYPNSENPDRYFYPKGRRLMINGLPVMDTCEGDWASKTVQLAFAVDGIHFLPSRHKLKVLERGAGLNMAGNKVIEALKARGSGEYHVIELNHDVAEATRRWRNSKLASISDQVRRYGDNPDVEIFVYEGEATEITAKLAEENNKFNIIISDTYPLTENQEGINDIEDAATIKKMLYPNGQGVFAFYTFYPGFEKEKGGDGFLTPRQTRILRDYFPARRTDVAKVNPPPEYTYLFGPDGKPIRELPVVVAINYDE